jgi:hypothetical protein
MPAGSKPAKSVPQPFFEASDIFKIVSRQQAAHRNIDTDLTAGVWGHMVLVLGPLPIYEGYWRIMTVRYPAHYISRSSKTRTILQITTKAHNTDDFIPFKNAPLAQHRMQLELGREIPFTRASYLRTKEEYWIEERGLLERVGHVRLRGPKGMKKLLRLVDAEEEDEEREEQEDKEQLAGEMRALGVKMAEMVGQMAELEARMRRM